MGMVSFAPQSHLYFPHSATTAGKKRVSPYYPAAHSRIFLHTRIPRRTLARTTTILGGGPRSPRVSNFDFSFDKLLLLEPIESGRYSICRPRYSGRPAEPREKNRMPTPDARTTRQISLRRTDTCAAIALCIRRHGGSRYVQSRPTGPLPHRQGPDK